LSGGYDGDDLLVAGGLKEAKDDVDALAKTF